jgi:hypothetical protein
MVQPARQSQKGGSAQKGSSAQQGSPAQQGGQAGSSPVKKPTADDFKAEAIQNAVLQETLQHPGTIYPLAGSGLALAWTVLIGATPASLGVTLGLAFLGASAFVYNFVIKGPERAVAHVSKLRQLRRQYTDSVLNKLMSDCMSHGFISGAKEAKELGQAWRQLSTYLEENKTGVSAEKFRLMAEDSCHQGVTILEQALSVFKALRSVDVNTLSNELITLRERLGTLEPTSGQARSLKVQIESHEKRLHLYTQSKERLMELIAESNEIESVLQSTYLELADLGNQSIDDFLSEGGGASSRLASAVETARRIEAKLHGGEDAELNAKKSKYIQETEQEAQPGPN